jgi:hypothetical protein
MSSTQSPEASSAGVDDPNQQHRKHVHHGQTLAAWVGSLTAMVAFFLGGFAVVFQNWTLFTIAVVLLVAAGVAVKVLQRAGHGAN